MPEETGGSGLVWLVWAAWIYCSTYWWLEHLASLEQAEKERQNSLNFSAEGGAVPLNAPAARPGARAVVSEILLREGSAMAEFLNERLAEYETIIAAFDAGDREALRDLVSPDVYEIFVAAIAARASHHQTIETVFSRIEPEIVDGMMDPSHMEVSVRFVGESFRLPRDAAGKPAAGAPRRHRTVDVWTFGRTLSLGKSPWRLVATDAES